MAVDFASIYIDDRWPLAKAVVLGSVFFPWASSPATPEPPQPEPED